MVTINDIIQHKQFCVAVNRMFEIVKSDIIHLLIFIIAKKQPHLRDLLEHHM